MCKENTNEKEFLGMNSKKKNIFSIFVGDSNIFSSSDKQIEFIDLQGLVVDIAVFS